MLVLYVNSFYLLLPLQCFISSKNPILLAVGGL